MIVLRNVLMFLLILTGPGLWAQSRSADPPSWSASRIRLLSPRVQEQWQSFLSERRPTRLPTTLPAQDQWLPIFEGKKIRLMTPLGLAVEQKKSLHVRLLLEAGANPNQINYTNHLKDTALDLGRRVGTHLDIMETLRKHGALTLEDLWRRDLLGNDPVMDRVYFRSRSDWYNNEGFDRLMVELPQDSPDYHPLDAYVARPYPLQGKSFYLGYAPRKDSFHVSTPDAESAYSHEHFTELIVPRALFQVLRNGYKDKLITHAPRWHEYLGHLPHHPAIDAAEAGDYELFEIYSRVYPTSVVVSTDYHNGYRHHLADDLLDDAKALHFLQELNDERATFILRDREENRAIAANSIPQLESLIANGSKAVVLAHKAMKSGNYDLLPYLVPLSGQGTIDQPEDRWEFNNLPLTFLALKTQDWSMVMLLIDLGISPNAPRHYGTYGGMYSGPGENHWETILDRAVAENQTEIVNQLRARGAILSEEIDYVQEYKEMEANRGY